MKTFFFKCVKSRIYRIGRICVIVRISKNRRIGKIDIRVQLVVSIESHDTNLNLRKSTNARDSTLLAFFSFETQQCEHERVELCAKRNSLIFS